MTTNYGNPTLANQATAVYRDGSPVPQLSGYVQPVIVVNNTYTDPRAFAGTSPSATPTVLLNIPKGYRFIVTYISAINTATETAFYIMDGTAEAFQVAVAATRVNLSGLYIPIVSSLQVKNNATRDVIFNVLGFLEKIM